MADEKQTEADIKAFSEAMAKVMRDFWGSSPPFGPASWLPMNWMSWWLPWVSQYPASVLSWHSALQNAIGQSVTTAAGARLDDASRARAKETGDAIMALVGNFNQDVVATRMKSAADLQVLSREIALQWLAFGGAPDAVADLKARRDR